MIHPSQLPRIRQQMLRHLADPQASMRAHTGQQAQPLLDTLEAHLRHAALYAVSPDMAALAMSSGSQLPETSWAAADPPAPYGLILFQEALGNLSLGGVDCPADACSWGPLDGRLLVWVMISRRRIAAEMRRLSSPVELAEEQVPPLLPLVAQELPVTSPVTAGDLPAMLSPLLRALAASWLLMQQPQLSDRTTQRPDRATRRSVARAALTAPDVTVVELRRQYRPDRQGVQEEVDPQGRRYRHRWVVTGHWRQQPYGPGRSQRRRQWIPSHIKGPERAPLLTTQRVNLWRR